MKSFAFALWFCCAIGAIHGAAGNNDMPRPFTRELKLRSPPMMGKDVLILQNFLARQVPCTVTEKYDEQTKEAVETFQKSVGLSVDGIVGPNTAQAALTHLSRDHYVDDGRPASDYGLKYKVHIITYQNRSVESTGTLYAANNTVLYRFPVRLHGHDTFGNNSWPNFDSCCDGLNEFSSDGNTPTGLSLFDFNSPEGIPRLYGPYPINRMVKGLKGNAAFLVPHVRDGILLHTGQWPGWTPEDPMPNSSGCIHSHPSAIKEIANILESLGVVMRKNPGGVLPYPYTPQGLISVEQADQCAFVAGLV